MRAIALFLIDYIIGLVTVAFWYFIGIVLMNQGVVEEPKGIMIGANTIINAYRAIIVFPPLVVAILFMYPPTKQNFIWHLLGFILAGFLIIGFGFDLSADTINLLGRVLGL